MEPGTIVNFNSPLSRPIALSFARRDQATFPGANWRRR
jgi:hypothetical protein